MPPDVRFNAKMHKIRFLLGLIPRPALVAYSTFPPPVAVFKAGTTSKERGGGREREGKGSRVLPTHQSYSDHR